MDRDEKKQEIQAALRQANSLLPHGKTLGYDPKAGRFFVDDNGTRRIMGGAFNLIGARAAAALLEDIVTERQGRP
jgi:hypothetical protein